jgi:hypothetical protein
MGSRGEEKKGKKTAIKRHHTDSSRMGQREKK